MDWYYVITGIMAALGALAHLVLGELWIISPLDPEKLTTQKLHGDTVKRYLRWFWHIGTFYILFLAVGSLYIGLTNRFYMFEPILARILAFFFAGMGATYLVVAIPSPRHFYRIPQGPLMILASILLWLGSKS
ncbi:MAG: hypothetical protein HOM21_12850 [Halobacteriovoraceae bacterium]|jgi:hypothetical protein|nr:hypothetical protein [Halobacteriovoraceae bacterium]